MTLLIIFMVLVFFVIVPTVSPLMVGTLNLLLWLDVAWVLYFFPWDAEEEDEEFFE